MHDPGGDGTLAVGPRGELAVRIIPRSGSGYTSYEGQDGVAVSEDGGATWSFRDLPGNRTYDGGIAGEPSPDDTPRWADPVAFDHGGVLYAAWGEGEDLLLARSRDLARTWSVVVLASGEGTAFYPHLVRGPRPGELAATWFTRNDDVLRARIAQVDGADTDAPQVRAASVQLPDGSGTGGEYFQAAFLQGGGIGFALTFFSPEEKGFEYRTFWYR